MSPGYTESKTDRLVNCKAGWASPNSIKKHMFFKKCSWTVRTSIQKQYHFPICKDGEENGMKPVFMFALQCFFYVHPLSLYSGLCYLHFLMFFFRGIGIHHDNEPPVSNQVSMSNLRGCQVSIQPVHNSRKPSLRESGTQFFGGSSCWRCAALNGMVGGFSIGCLEWPDCWNTTKQR